MQWHFLCNVIHEGCFGGRVLPRADVGTAELTLDRIAKDRLILGDPEECLTEFQRWQEATGAETCLLRLRHAHSGGPSHGQIMKTIDLIGDRIIPYCD